MTPNYSTYDDGELLRFLQNDDYQAFTAIYEKYWEQLLGMAFNRLKSVQAAEDIVHDVFASLWKNRAHAEINSLSSYLAVSLKYAVLRTIYRNNFIREYSKNQLFSAKADVEATFEDFDLIHIVREELDKLPPKCKVIFEYSRLEGYTNKEIATELNISVKTVENQINTAQRHLRVALKNSYTLLPFLFY